MIHDYDLKDCLLRINKPHIIDYVLHLVQQVLSELNEPVNSPKLAFKARANKRAKNGVDRPLNFSINDLVVLSLYAQGFELFCELLIEEEEGGTHASSFKIIKTERGQGSSNAYWIVVTAEEFIKGFNSELYQLWKDKCQRQLNKAGASPYRNTRTEELHRLVADDDFRRDTLQSLLTHFKDKSEPIIGARTVHSSNKNTMKRFSLNTILYGPPGTGKTYNTINRAVQIINPSFFDQSKSRDEVKAEYERLREAGHVEFITFHQSMSYEDFIEGIKPKKPEDGDEFLKYVTEEGIFKKIAKRAGYKPSPQTEVFSLSEEEFNNASFYKISLGNTAISDDEQIYRYCIDNGYIALGWGGANDFSVKTENEIQQMVPSILEKFAAQAVNYFVHYIKRNDIVVVSYGNLRFRAIGKVIGDYEYRNVSGLEVKQFRRVHWLLKDVDIPVEEVYNKQFSQQSIYKLNKSQLKKSFLVHATSELKPIDAKPETVFTFDKVYTLFLDKIKADLATTYRYSSYFLNGRNKRVQVKSVDGDKIITRGEEASADDPIHKERLKKIYDRYKSPNDIRSVGDLRDIDTAIGWVTNYYAVFKAFKEFESTILPKVEIKSEHKVSTIPADTKENNYVLIIDEINRGNIAQIFGELITLIEPDKRKNASEALELILPYSKEPFSVPSNLYILGTMNTADRSVEALDTALRRRFSFEEMMPNPSLLNPKQMLCSFWNQPDHIKTNYQQWIKEPYLSKTDAFYELIGFSREQEAEVLDTDYETDRKDWLPEDFDMLMESDYTGVNLQVLLDTINKRLEKLLSKDHQIGHAFFINVASVQDLYTTFYQKLIPQLQEYFFGDFGKIGLVLGADFVKSGEVKRRVAFASFPYEDLQMLQEKPLYYIHDFSATQHPDYQSFFESVKKIYQ